MTAPPYTETSGAVAAMRATVDLLRDAGIDAITDVGAFFPAPIGVLVTLPTLTNRGQRSNTFSVPILIVSGDPLNTEMAVGRIYAIADDAARTVRTAEYRPGSWAGNINAEPLPAIEMAATVTIRTEEP